MLPFEIPWWLEIALVTLTFVLIACAGHVAVKRTFLKADFDSTRLTTDVGRYVNAVLSNEWPKMKNGRSSDAAQTQMVSLFNDAAGMRAITTGPPTYSIGCSDACG